MKNIFAIRENENWIRIKGVQDFSVYKTFDCGQCFRFNSVNDPTYSNEVDGIAFGKYVRFADDNGDIMISSSEDDFSMIWKKYLALDIDYEEINREIIKSNINSGKEYLLKAVEVSKGIHILRQDKWEALCSFIISQNNNIPRIKKIIEEMCKRYGEKIENGYSFPSPEILMEAGEESIFNLKTGFRAKYIYDAACKVSSGIINLDGIYEAPTYEEAEKELLTICGVGPKVAACTLLFGFERLEAFPIDVWIKRVIEKRFPDGLDPKIFGEYAGVAQQYLFYCERYIG